MAKACARSMERLATATASAPATYGKSLITREAMRPGPMIPQRTVCESIIRRGPAAAVAYCRRSRR